MEIGLENILEYTVTKKDTAKKIGSGTLDVLATPRLIALMEQCAYTSIEPYLDYGTTSVGVSVDIKHISPTPVSMKLKINSKIESIRGREIKFFIVAFDEKGEIASGEHTRFIVNEERFLQKVEAKLV